MDRRSWPWKKKSSERSATASDSAAAPLSKTGVKQQEEKQHTKTVNFAQISIEKYEYLSSLEEQIELLKEQLSYTKEKLCSSQAEMKTKDELVKQHAKVAEEAISGWEKAEAEALALKRQLESVTLLKLGAEERATHLDGALKECMKQVRNVREESELKLHNVVLTKTKQWEKVKAELESTISSFEQELLKCSSETALLSRSLQERSVSLMKVGEDKARADAEIEVFKTHIQSYEKEVNSLKYELNIAAKELEIRNEEKNMSVKSAEVANKQHNEDVKKITKLEAECQRLRGLVRKKLPGAAALAQMKLEVENLNQGFGESKTRRQSGQNSSSYPLFAPDAMVIEVEQYRKDHEYLASRLLAMEEETKMLKEALSKRNTELQVSRNTCAKTANNLCSLEAQLLAMNHQKSSSKLNAGISFEGSLSQNGSNQSLASMSNDGVDDQASCVESRTSALASELSQLKKEKTSERTQLTHNTNQLELMDDFLEMERLAGLSSDSNGIVSGSNEWAEKMKENYDDTSSVDVHIDVCKEQVSGLMKHPGFDLQTDNQCLGNLLSKLKTQIASVVETKVTDGQMEKLLEGIMAIVQAVPHDLHHHPKNLLCGEAQYRVGEVPELDTSLNQGDNMCRKIENTSQELRNAISWIHDFVVSFYKEASQAELFEVQAAREKVEEFSNFMSKLIKNELKLDDFVVSLFHVFSEIIKYRSKIWDMGDNNSIACIDKATLLENGVAFHDPIEGNSSELQSLPASSSPDVFGGPADASAELKDASQSIPTEEFEHVKLERNNLEADLAKCRETLGSTKLQLSETEQQLAELKLQLSACQKSNDLAETQLRCMTESYKCLESRAHQLESEISLLRSKAEALESELNAERHNHQEDITKYNDLQEQMRNKHCLKCSCHSNSNADADSKERQEREIAAAAEKLAACQETIVLLNKQLTALCPTAEQMSTSSYFREEAKTVSSNSQRSQISTFADDATEISQSEGMESPLHEYSSQVSTSDMESSPTLKQSANPKRPKHRSKSSSASSLSSMLNEKQGRLFSRFFVKGRAEI